MASYGETTAFNGGIHRISMAKINDGANQRPRSVTAVQT